MTDDQIIILISRVLCRVAGRINPCPYCEDGQCSDKMRETFMDEATAVFFVLKNNGIIR